MGALLIQKGADGQILCAVVPDMAPDQMQGAQPVPDLQAAAQVVMDVLGDEGEGGRVPDESVPGQSGDGDYSGTEEQHPGNQEQPGDPLDPASAGDNVPRADNHAPPARGGRPGQPTTTGKAEMGIPPRGAAGREAAAMDSGYQSVKGSQPRRRN